MKITILSVSVETKPTAKGSYQVAIVAYKSEQNKIEGRNVMSFGDSAEAFKVLSQASQGEVYEVTAVKKLNPKDNKEYWNWTQAVRTTAAAPSSTTSYQKTQGTATPKSTYETPEERAKKQVYIVRQSSISAAIAVLSVGAKAAPKSDDILALAKQFEDFVFDNNKAEVANETIVKPDDMDDDIPF